MDLINQLLEQDFHRFLEDEGHVFEGENIRCPFHEDHNPSLHVSLKEGVWLWFCHGCRRGGNIINYVMHKQDVSKSAAIKWLAEKYNLNGKPELVASYSYQDETGQELFKVLRFKPKSFKADRKMTGVRQVPYRLPEILAADEVWVVEGEKDADNVRALGLTATTSPFGVSHWRSSFSEFFKGKSVNICLDCGYRTESESRARDIARFAREVRIIELPGLKKDDDISDWIEQHDAQAAEDLAGELRTIAAETPIFDAKRERDENEDASLAECDPRTVKVRPIPWIWPGVIPTHMATSLPGDAGIGKSLVGVDITARITRGKPFPAYDQTGPPVKGHVFYVTSEGVPEMILVPRLIAAGADLSKITIVEGVYMKTGEFSMFDVTKHLPMLTHRAQDFPDLKLIIIDPVASFIPERINTNQQNQVRQTMDRISDIAYRLGVAAITIMHFSKALGIKAAHKTAGSIQFGAAVKMSWAVVRREGDPRNARLLVPQKSNITGNHHSISFAIREAKFPAADDPKTIITTAKIEYGELVDEDPEILISPPVENDSNVAAAVRFLNRKLQDGTTLYAVQLIDEAETNGIPKWALYKAKDRLGVAHDKEGHFQGRTFWFKPQEKNICS